MKMPSQADATLDAYFRTRRSIDGPAWRMQWASELAATGADLDVDCLDELTRAAARYWKLRDDASQGEQAAAAAFPSIAAAVLLIGDASKSELLKLATLAALSIEEIAAAAGADVAAVANWQALSFDVTSLLELSSWIGLQVFHVERERGNVELAAKLTLAYIAGRPAFEAIQAMAAGRCLDAADELLQRWIKIDVKMKVAAEMKNFTPSQQLAYVQTVAGLIAAENRITLEREKLAARCAEHRDRQAAADLRRQDKEERRILRGSTKRARKFEQQRREERQSAEQTAVFLELAKLQAAEAARRRAAESPLAKLSWNASAAPAADTASAADERTCGMPVASELGDDLAAEPVAPRLVVGHSQESRGAEHDVEPAAQIVEAAAESDDELPKLEIRHSR